MSSRSRRTSHSVALTRLAQISALALAATGDVLEAAALGSAAASFAIATEDPLTLIAVDRDQVVQRARHLRGAARRIGRGSPLQGGDDLAGPSAANG